MKVLHVLNSRIYSGAENVAITIIRNMSGQVESAYAALDGPIGEILKEYGIKYFPMESEPIKRKELRKIIKEYKPDIIHAHGFTASVMSGLSETGIPIISHLHNNKPWARKVGMKTIAYFCSGIRYKEILTVSSPVMDEFVFGRFLKKKTKVIGNPIELDRIRSNTEEKGILRESSDVVFMGRFCEQKNPQLFLEIMEELVKQKPDLRVAMIGSGELKDEIEKRIAASGLASNVVLYGFVENPYGLLESSKLMCMPSKWEGFGLAAVEEMAFGKPVVAAPVGGLADIINNECGALCREKEEYVREISRLLTDSDYYAAKCRKALEKAEELGNIEAYRKMIGEIYQGVLKKK